MENISISYCSPTS